MKLQRFDGNPILSPEPQHPWENLAVFNVVNGIVWQLCLMTAPMCLVVRKWDTFWWTVGILVVTSGIMKFTWYDRLPPADSSHSKGGE